MSEKKVYVFASRWGANSASYWQYCLDNNIVFINNECDSAIDYSKIARDVKKGDIIALRDGETMYVVGIANNDASVKNILSGSPLFTNEKELNQYGIDSNVEVVAVTVEHWHILSDDDKLMLNISGLRERIKLLVDDKYNQARAKILSLLDL